MIIFNRSINNNVSVSVLDGTNPKYVYIPSVYYDGTTDNTITGIRENGFADLTNLENIIIPNTIVSIDDGALSGCTNLATLHIPTSVTSIGAGALSDCTTLNTVNIPDSVTAISDSLFARCSNLSTLIIPSSIVSIGANAFTYCESLSGITIPSSVTEIGSGALSGCTSLTEIVIPSSVTIIGSNVFSDSPNLTNITIAPGNTAFTTDGKALYNSAYTILQKYYETNDTSYTIPSTVVTTDDYSFQNATALTSMTIPSTITSIGEYMFTGCSGLESVVFSSGSTGVRNGMFVSCSNLTSVSLPSSLTSIGNYGFSQCNSLAEIDLTYIKSIGSDAFEDCTNISTLTIGDQCTSIGASAFANCSSVSTVLFDGNYPTIGTNAFSGLASDAVIYFNPEKTGWTNYATINGVSTIALVYISGTFTQQQTLTANNQFVEAGIVPNGTVFSYQWYEDSLPISGATASTLDLKYDQVDKTIHVAVSYNIGGSLTTLTSISSSAVDAFNNLPTGTVSISGSNTPSSVLTATNTIADVDGLGTFYYQWYRNTTSSNVGGTEITDATNTTYTLSGIDANAYIYVKLYYTDNYGTPEIVYSSPTLQIVGLPPSYLSASSYGDESSTITFETNPDAINYQVYAYIDGNDTIFSTTTGNTSPITVSGLTVDTSFNFKVASVFGSYTTSPSIASNTVEIYSSSGLTISSNRITGFTGTQSNVMIPSSVTSIGSSAFANKTGIQKVYIGSGVTSISVATTTHSFVGCSNINTFTIDPSNTIFSTDGYSLLNAAGTMLYRYMKQSSASYTVPNTIIIIGEYAFGNCSSLTSLAIGSGVASIVGISTTTHSFVGCSNINTFTIDPSNTFYSSDGYSLLNASGTTLYHYMKQSSASYTVPNTILTIGAYAFGNCSSLTSLTIGSGVTSISVATTTHSFVGCSNINTFTINIFNTTYSSDGYSLLDIAGTTLYHYMKQSSASYTIPNTILTIGVYAFGNCSSLTSLTIGSGVTSIVGTTTLNHPFVGCSNINTFEVHSSNTIYSTDGYSLLNKLGTSIYLYMKQSSASYTIPNTIRTILTSAFCNCTSLTSLSIGSGVTSIVTGALNHSFVGCSNINTFTIHSSNTTYSTDGYSLFNKAGTILYHYITQSSASYTVPNTILTIGAYAFGNCSSLTSLAIGSGVTSITVGSATHSFVGCSSINTFTIHSSNTTYSTDGYSLLNKAGTTLWNYITQGLDSYTIQNTVLLIGAYAFGNCSNLTSVSIGSGVTGINIALTTHSFIGCSNINTFTVNPSNSTYSTDGYSLLNKAGTTLHLYVKRTSTSYIIPNTITTLNTFSFYNCTELTSVSIGSSVTTINADVFNMCRGLVNITIPNSVTSIGTGLFVSCSGLTNVTIGSGITSIPNVIFGNCTSLSSFIIPDTVKSISTNTFSNCTSLRSVSIGSGLTSISVGGTTHSFIGCTAINTFIISASNTTYSTDGYSLLNKAGTILYLYVNRTLTSYTIPNTITTLNTYSFYNCIGLTTLTIPESVTSVGANGVTSNSNLATIIFNGNRPSTITVATSFLSNKSGCIGYYYPNKTGWPGTAITGLTLTSLLAISGSKSANGTLTATQYLSTIGATGLTYLWYSNSSNSNTGGSLISFATSSSFTHGSAYTYVYVTVSYTLSGSSSSLTSNVF